MHSRDADRGGRYLGWLAAGVSHDDIMADCPELTEGDVRAALSYAADRERLVAVAGFA